MATPASAAGILGFVKAAKDRGVGDDLIVNMLRQNGWPDREIFGAFAEHYDALIGVPVPERRQSGENARDAFYYVLNFITLGFWTVALGQVFYILIAHWLPDPAQYEMGSPLREQISWQVATVIVAFPVFVFIHSLIRKELQTRPDLYESGVRKWLTYIALVIAAITVITDGVWFIEALIRGELTFRFICDSLVLLVLGGGVFWYYLSTMEPQAAPAPVPA